MATTYKIIDPAGNGDYDTIDEAIADATLTGDVILYCAKGCCTGTDSVELEIGLFTGDSLQIFPLPGHGHNGDLSQPLADCAWMYKHPLWTLDTTLRSVQMHGMRMAGMLSGQLLFCAAGENTSGTYTFLAMSNLAEMMNSGSADVVGVEVEADCTLNVIVANNGLFETSGSVGSNGYIVMYAIGSTINLVAFNNVGASASPANMVDGIHLNASGGGAVSAYVENNAFFNVSAEGTSGAYAATAGVTITNAANNMSDDATADDFGATGAQNNVAATDFFADAYTRVIPVWQRSSLHPGEYQVGEKVQGTLTGGYHIYECTVAGVPRATGTPTWSTTGGTFLDHDGGTLEWHDLGIAISADSGSQYQKATSPGVDAGATPTNAATYLTQLYLSLLPVLSVRSTPTTWPIGPTVDAIVRPAKANVKSGVDRGDGVDGTYDPMAAAVFPAANRVYPTGTKYGPTGSENDGTLRASNIHAVAGGDALTAAVLAKGTTVDDVVGDAATGGGLGGGGIGLGI